MKEAITKGIHDIRGSLNVVLGFIEYVDKRRLKPDALELWEASQSSLEKIEKSLDEMKSIVQGETTHRCTPHLKSK